MEYKAFLSSNAVGLSNIFETLLVGSFAKCWWVGPSTFKKMLLSPTAFLEK